MDILIPRYLAPQRRLTDGLIPPSPPAERRKKTTAEILREVKTWRGRLPAVEYNEPGRPSCVILPGMPAYQETLRRAICMPAGSVTILGGSPANPLASLTDASWYGAFQTTAWLDSTSGGNNLTGNGSPTTTTGKIGNAINLSGSQYASCAYASAFNVGGIDFTVNGWIYPTALTNFNYAWAKYSTQRDWGLDLFGSQANFVASNAFNGSNSAVAAATFGNLSTNTWYMVTCQVIAASNLMKITVNNGTFDTANTLTNGARNGASGDFYVGWDNVNNKWAGRIDELGLWKRAITSGEITLLYNSGAGASPFA